MDNYSSDVVRSKLTRDVAGIFKQIREELVMAMDESISTRNESTWQSPR